MTDTAARRTWGLAALIVFQAICASFFLGDVLADMMEFATGENTTLHLGIEFAATLGLLAGIVVEGVVLVGLLRRAARSEKAMTIAQGALHELMERYFADWGLTPSEADVAAFTLKGYSIAEIAGFRGSAEGTVKTHLNAIYRKAGVAGRGQFVSLLIEDLMRAPLLPDVAAQQPIAETKTEREARLWREGGKSV
jgi:DNA-binding CsgD family transcriptional regulator